MRGKLRKSKIGGTMPVEKEARKRPEEPIFITIRDPKTGTEIEYRVTAEVGITINQLLEGIEGKAPPWDKGCRLARTG
jgi:hypothetical protein